MFCLTEKDCKIWEYKLTKLKGNNYVWLCFAKHNSQRLHLFLLQTSAYSWTTSLNVWTVVWRSSRASSPSSRTSSGEEPRSNSTTAKSWTSCRRRSPTETKSTNRSKSNEQNQVKLLIMSASKVILVKRVQKTQAEVSPTKAIK